MRRNDNVIRDNHAESDNIKADEIRDNHTAFAIALVRRTGRTNATIF